MKTKSWTDRGIDIIKWLFSIIFLAFLFYSIYYVAADKAPLLESEPILVLKDWTYYDQNGDSYQLSTPTLIPGKTDGDTFIFESKLPDSYPEGSVIAFLNLSNVDLMIDGETIYSFRRDEVPILGSLAKNSYFIIDLPSEYAGGIVRIVRHDNLMKRVTDVYVGEKEAVVRKLEEKGGITHFILSLFLLVFSVVTLIGSVVIESIIKRRIPLSTIAVGAMVASTWLVYDSFVFQFVTRTRFIDGIMSYICTLGMTFGFIFYLNEIQKKRYQKLYFVIGLIELLNMIVFGILHFTGIQPFSQSLLTIDIVILIAIVSAFAISIYDIVKKQAQGYRITVIGFLIFMVCCAVEIVFINVVQNRVEGSFIMIGLFVLMGCAIAQQIIDIRRVQHERDLATANANARTQFLANMSHEIRTPINSILGMNEMIIKETTDSQIASYAKIASDAGEILLSLINDILDFSKLDSGKHELVLAPYNPSQLFGNISSIIVERAHAKGLKMDFSVDPRLPRMLYGDSKSLSEIILNLLSNAVKYTEIGGISMKVLCEVKDKETGTFNLTFKISDTGIGIKDEDQDMIFNPFSRTDLKKNQSIQGTGLGLAITKQLVEEMDGCISLTSKYGEGSTFTVIIPQRIPTDEELKSHVDIKDNRIDTGDDVENFSAPSANVLVVDDTRANIIVVRAFLKRVGILPDLAGGGLEAVQKCCENKYDVIFMDHMMPECDGVEAMHMIKEKPESLNADTPIIVLTANAIKGSEEEYRKMGFDNYLSKPVDSASLIRAAKAYLPEEKIQK